MLHGRKENNLEAFARLPDTTFIWKYENLSDSFAVKEVAEVSDE